ncbi:MAG: DUF2272 domain-containing protein [Pseudomonadota bacterium]
MLQISINEANAGVHELHQPFRVAEYWSSLGYDFTGLDRDVPWSAAFVSWVIRQSGNPHDLKLAPNHFSIWSHANEKGFSLSPTATTPVPGDIAVRMRRESDADAWNGQDGIARGFSGFVYDVNDDEIVVIGGNASHSVRPTTWDREDPRIVGFIRLPDLPAKVVDGAEVNRERTDVEQSTE